MQDAARVTRAALSGLRAVVAWPGAPRPVEADALLPERALAGDADARTQLRRPRCTRPLVDGGRRAARDAVGASSTPAGRSRRRRAPLFVHANTVRYRMRRVAELCGHSPMDARGALTLRLALVLGRLAAEAPEEPVT